MAILGINVWVCLGEGSAATIIAGTRSNEIQTNVDTIEISSPTSGIWKQHKNIRKDWSISTSFLCLANEDVQKLLQVGNTYTIQVVGQEGSASEVLLSGSAILTSCKITASVANLVQGSFVFDGNGELTSDQPVPPTPQNPQIAWSADSATATIGGTNTFPTLSNPHSLPITYSSSDTSVATVDSSGVVTLVAAGSVYISASFAGSAEYYSSTVSYSLAVEAALPYDAEILYLGNASQCLINASVTGNAKIIGLAKADSTSGTTKVLLASTSLASGGTWYGYTSYWYIAGTSGTTQIPSTNAARFELTFNNSGITGNVEGKSITRSASVTQGDWYIFNNSNLEYAFSGNIYYMKFYQNNVLVRDFIPVRVGQVGYLFDKISESLFANSNTGSFVVGPDINNYDSKIEYIESTGTQWIDTGIASTNITWNITAQVTTTATSNAILIGGYDSGGAFFGDIHGVGNKWGAGGSAGNYSNINSTTKADIVLNFNSATVSGTVNGSSFSRTGTAPSDTFTLFGTRSSSTHATSYLIKARVFSLKGYINNVLVRDFIPVRVGQVGYLYDKVSNKLFDNYGTGLFTLGPDKQ